MLTRQKGVQGKELERRKGHLHWARSGVALLEVYLLATGRQVCRLVSQHLTLSLSFCSAGLTSPRE